jgi:hypothetical protein
MLTSLKTDILAFLSVPSLTEELQREAQTGFDFFRRIPGDRLQSRLSFYNTVAKAGEGVDHLFIHRADHANRLKTRLSRDPILELQQDFLGSLFPNPRYAGKDICLFVENCPADCIGIESRQDRQSEARTDSIHPDQEHKIFTFFPGQESIQGKSILTHYKVCMKEDILASFYLIAGRGWDKNLDPQTTELDDQTIRGDFLNTTMQTGDQPFTPYP